MNKNWWPQAKYAGHRDVQKWTMATLGDRWLATARRACYANPEYQR